MLDRASGKVSWEEMFELLLKGKQETAAHKGAQGGRNLSEDEGDDHRGREGRVVPSCSLCTEQDVGPDEREVRVYPEHGAVFRGFAFEVDG